MPELPEVETIRRQLEPVVVGRTITRVRVDDPLVVSPASPRQFATTVEGQGVAALSRRGKYLRFELASGDTMVIHLRMTGQLHVRSGRARADRHLRVRFRFDDATIMDFIDLRRFGRIWVLPADHPDIDGYWDARTGVEPLSDAFTVDRLADALSGRRTAIKAALLDQRRVAGIGNIYADEALFLAGIHPLTTAGEIPRAAVARLRDAIVDRLTVGIASGGASIDRYRDTLGQTGTMQDMLNVHLHAGDPCPQCGTTIQKIRVAQRGTYICPSCQPGV